MLYDTIKREAEEVRTLMRDLQTEATDWQQTNTDSRGTKVMWKPSKNSPIHTLRLDGTLKMSMFNILAVLMEVDLYPSWIPTIMGVGLKDLQLLDDMDRFRKLAHAEVSIPWPLANRDCNVVGYGVDFMDQQRALTVVRSYETVNEVPLNVNWSLFAETEHLAAEERQVSKEATSSRSSPKASVASSASSSATASPIASPAPTPSPKPTETAAVPVVYDCLRDEVAASIERAAKLVKPAGKNSKVVRARVERGGFLLTAVSEHETELSCIFQIDPKLAVVPSWLINWCMKHFCFTVFALLESTAAKVGTPESPFTQRMTDKPEVYDYLRERLKANDNLTNEEREERRQNSLQILDSPLPLHPELVEKFSEPTISTPSPTTRSKSK